MSKVVPPNVIVAAKRGFVRTTAQAYATALAGGVSSAALLSWVQEGANVPALVITGVVAVVSPLLAGLGSYLSILAKGIPEDYQAG